MNREQVRSDYDDEILIRASLMFGHHDGSGDSVVHPGQPDVFVVGNANDGYDIAVRIDAGYTSWDIAANSAEVWGEQLRRMTAAMRAAESERDGDE